MATKITLCCTFERQRRMFQGRVFALPSDHKFVASQEHTVVIILSLIIMQSLDNETVGKHLTSMFLEPCIGYKLWSQIC